MRRNGVAVETIRPAAMPIAYGVQPDMTGHGWPRGRLAGHLGEGEGGRDPDRRHPDLARRGELGLPADDRAALRHVGLLNDRGQSIYYGKVGGCVITGNEDGIKHCSMSILYALGHLGYTIPPQADCGWIGEAGPGPSYGDDDGKGGGVGLDNDFTQRNTTIMTWNLMHLARMLKDAGGLPNHGNDRRAWKAGCRFDYANPEHRA